MKLEVYLTQLTKTNPKCIKDLNIRMKTIKLPEENLGEKFLDLGFGNDFFWIRHLKPKQRNQK